MSLTKNEIREFDLTLMSLRCEFISGLVLTKKGRSLLSPKQWRMYNDIKGFIFPKWKDDMVRFLKSVAKEEQQSRA